MSKRLSWEKELVVYHIKSMAFHTAFDLVSSAKRSVSCSNRNTGRVAYAYMPWTEYWKAKKV
jgi:hypothetical protein